MRAPLISLIALATIGSAAAAPTCPLLLASFERSLASASSVTISVTLEQGGREIAFERSRVDRSDDGIRTATTLERRGLRRPEAGQTAGAPPGGGALPTCDDHDLTIDEASAVLTLRALDPDSVAPTVTLRFDEAAGTWLPTALEAPFTVRLLFVPVRGRFLTTFEAWSFQTANPPQEESE